MKSQILLATLALSVVPVLSSHALILEPEVQFKTLEQIQADALAELENPAEELTEDEARRQRLINLTRSSNTGVNRVKSAKENFKKRSTTGKTVGTTGSSIGKNRSFRGSRARQAESTYQSSESTQDGKSTRFESDISTTIRARLRQRLAEKQAAEAAGVESLEADKVYADFVPEPGQEWGR